MEYKNMYFIANASGVITSYDVEAIPQNSNNIKINFCGNYTDTTTVKLAIVQANNVTLPTRAVPLTTTTYTVGETVYRVYTYRLVQDDTKICPSATGTVKISFTVEDEGEAIVTTELINLTIAKTATGAVTNTPADTIDALTGQLNQDTADIADLQTQFGAFDTSLSNKVEKTTTIAGVDLQDNITKSELLIALNVADGAEVNVNSDWNAVSGDEQILNKPTTISGYGITDAYTKTETDNKLGLKLDVSPDGTNPLINTVTGKIDTTYYATGTNILKGQWNATTNTPELATTPTASQIGWIYDVSVAGTFESIDYEIGDQIKGYDGYWGKIDNTDKVTSVQNKTGAVVLKGSEIEVSETNADKLDIALGKKANTTDVDNSLALKLNKADKYTAPIALGYDLVNEYWAWNYANSDNAIITFSGSEATDINITNATSGDIGVVTVKGGQLTLPANSILSADFGYLTAVGNQYYRYSFYYDGTNFEWSRTVLGDE